MPTSQEQDYEIRQEKRELSSKLLNGGALTFITASLIAFGHAEALIGVIPAFVVFRQAFNHNKRVNELREATKG